VLDRRSRCAGLGGFDTGACSNPSACSGGERQYDRVTSPASSAGTCINTPERGRRRHSSCCASPASHVIALDSAFGMLRAAGRRSRAGVFSTGVRGMPRTCLWRMPASTWSSAVLCCSGVSDAVFAEFRRVLRRADGLSFTSLRPDTLHELRALGQRGLAQPRQPLYQHARLKRCHGARWLCGAGARRRALHIDLRRKCAASRGSKTIGAHNCHRRPSQGSNGTRKFAAMRAAYETFRHEGHCGNL